MNYLYWKVWSGQAVIIIFVFESLERSYLYFWSLEWQLWGTAIADDWWRTPPKSFEDWIIVFAVVVVCNVHKEIRFAVGRTHLFSILQCFQIKFQQASIAAFSPWRLASFESNLLTKFEKFNWPFLGRLNNLNWHNIRPILAYWTQQPTPPN